MIIDPESSRRDTALDACQRREAQLRQVLDLVPDYIFANDEDGNVLLANAALAKAYGVRAKDMEGANTLDLDPDPEQARRLLELDRAAIAGGRPVHVPWMEVTVASGERRLIDLRMLPYVEAETNRNAVLGVGVDITERERAAEALREKERQDRELEIAREIQRALLPAEAPRVPGFRIAGWNEPADHTGGDYYDWLTLPDGRLLFTIADVTGHGIGPAILVSACRAYLRSCSRMEVTLEQVMERVDALLEPDLSGGRFVTAAVGVLDPNTGKVELFSAGHGPVLFYEARNRRVVHWPADGVPLGLMALCNAPSSRSRALQFEPGDALVLVTDGYHEWTDGDEQPFGVARLSRALEACAGGTPAEMIDAINEAVQHFAGGTRQSDDLTALVVQREPEGTT